MVAVDDDATTVMTWVALPTVTGIAKGNGGGGGGVDFVAVGVRVAGGRVLVCGRLLLDVEATAVVDGWERVGVVGTVGDGGGVDDGCSAGGSAEGDDDVVEVVGCWDEVLDGAAGLVRVGCNDGAAVVDPDGGRLLRVVFDPFAAPSGGTVMVLPVAAGCVLEIVNAAGELGVRV